MKKLLLILCIIFSASSLHAQGPGTMYGAYKFLGTIGIPKDTLLPPLANRNQPHVAAPGDSLFLWSWRQQKWILIIGAGGGGGTTYSNGYGLTLASTVFKVDTFAIETRARSLKQLDSLHALVTYTNGTGILPLSGNVIAVDTFQMATRGYAKLVGDSVRQLIGIPTLQTVITQSGTLNINNTLNLSAHVLTFNNGSTSLVSDVGTNSRQSRIDVTPGSIYFSTTSTAGLAYVTSTLAPDALPQLTFTISTTGGAHTSQFVGYTDSLVFYSYLGDTRFRNTQTTTDTANKPVVMDPVTKKIKYFSYWPGFGGGAGGTIRAYYVDNIIRSGFDSLFYWRSDTSFAGRGYKLAVNSSKLVLTRPAGENSDSTTSWLLDVVEANISRNNLGGGALTVANGGTNIASYTKGDILVATGSTTLVKLPVGTDGQVLTADAAQTSGIKWGTVGGGGTETDPHAILNQYTYQTNAAANIKSLTVKDTIWMPGHDSYIVEFPASGSGSNWINMSTGGASGIGSGGVGQDAWIAYAKFSAQYFPDATAGSIVFRSKTANLYFGVGTGSANSVMQIINSSATLRITKAGSTIITDTTQGVPAVVDASGNIIGRGHWYGGVSSSGTVTTVSVVSANGFAGTVANATTTPAITLTTSVTGIIKGNGTALSAATADVDYEAPHTTLPGYGITDALSNSTTSTQDGYFSTIKLKDVTNPSHYLTLDVNEDLTASRTLHIVTGDATRTLTFTGNATISGTNTGDQTISFTNDLSGSGTGSIAATITAGAVTLAKMANLGNQLIIGRNTSGTGVPEGISISQALDWLGTSQGSIAYRNASGWVVLAPGTDGNVLTTHSTGANPTWGGITGLISGLTTGKMSFATSATAIASTGGSSSTNGVAWDDVNNRLSINLAPGSIVGYTLEVGGVIRSNSTIRAEGNMVVGSVLSSPVAVIGTGSSTGMTEGTTLDVLLNNSGNGVQTSSIRVNQTASSTAVSSALQPWLRTTHSSGTVVDVRTFVPVFDQGSANPVTNARIVDASALMSNTTGGTITNLTIYNAQVNAQTSTATTVTNLYGFRYMAQGGAGTVTLSNPAIAFINEDVNAKEIFNGKVFLPTLGTTTSDKLVGSLASTGDLANITIGSGLSLSGNTLSATGASSSGSYTPSIAGQSNVTTVSAHTCYYTRVGNYVTVTGQVDVNVTTAGTASSFTFDLPVVPTSNFSSRDKLNGVMSQESYYSAGVIYGSSGAKTATVGFNSTATGTKDWHFTFTYETN
jgi:hypothetical protein